MKTANDNVPSFADLLKAFKPAELVIDPNRNYSLEEILHLNLGAPAVVAAPDQPIIYDLTQGGK